MGLGQIRRKRPNKPYQGVDAFHSNRKKKNIKDYLKSTFFTLVNPFKCISRGHGENQKNGKPQENIARRGTTIGQRLSNTAYQSSKPIHSLKRSTTSMEIS